MLRAKLHTFKRFRGKVVLIEAPDAPPKNIWVIFSRYSSFVSALERAGAVALIGGQGGFKSQGMHLTHTGSLIFAREASLPIVSIAAEDQGQIERLLAAGRTVRIHINVQNSFTTGSVPTANIVGDNLEAGEKPEQIVVLGAHLETWMQSEGATDNGTNVCSVLAAARALVKSGSRPRRTIRFVLFHGRGTGRIGFRGLHTPTQHRAAEPHRGYHFRQRSRANLRGSLGTDGCCHQLLLLWAPTTPAPAATTTRRNVPQVSAKIRRHS